MVSRFRTLCAAVAVAMPLVMVAASPATAAEANMFVMQGSGTITPGLSATLQSQSVGLVGTATMVGTHGVLTTYGCSFSGSFFGNLAGGTGNLSGTCGPMPLACAFVFVLGKWIGACAGSVTAAINCTVVYTTLNPSTSFDATCLGQSVKVP